MPSKITIIRHAPTAYNKKGIFMGDMDIPVENFVEADLQEARNFLSVEPYSVVYSSPLKRASETATRLLKNNYLIEDNRLRERCLGDWQGLKKEFVRERYKDAFRNGSLDFYYTPPNGETYQEVIIRVSDFITERYVDGENIIVVTHHGVFRLLKSLLTGEAISKTFRKCEPFLKPQTFYIDYTVVKAIRANPFYTVDSVVSIR